MSATVNRPVPNTIALGGVATGNMNANETHVVAGIIKYIGLTGADLDNFRGGAILNFTDTNLARWAFPF